MAASAPISKTIYLGSFVHSKTLTELDVCEKGAIGVDENGVIRFVERDGDGEGELEVEKVLEKVKEKVKEEYGDWREAKVVRIRGNGFFFPGFIGMYGFWFLRREEWGERG
jgi:guanine deaminase